jgi:prepilin-type N-terminal cleavage/methylation domain-containing protein
MQVDRAIHERCRRRSRLKRTRAASGFTLVEVLIVVAIIGLVSSIVIPELQKAVVRGAIAGVAAEGRTLHAAFIQWHLDKGQFPNAESTPQFNLRTFDPLRSEGYYRGNMVHLLLGGQADAYDSPDDEGPNAEFWLEMTLKLDPTVRFLVCDSKSAPMGGGRWLEGVYMFRNGELSPIQK